MNENAKRWVKTLRSGEYKQGHKRLRTLSSYNDECAYCCLGVACDLYAKEKGIQWNRDHILGHGGILPFEVSKWLGLGSKDGGFKDANGVADYLTVRNDQGATFEDIADIIESEPEGLFV